MKKIITVMSTKIFTYIYVLPDYRVECKQSQTFIKCGFQMLIVETPGVNLKTVSPVLCFPKPKYIVRSTATTDQVTQNLLFDTTKIRN